MNFSINNLNELKKSIKYKEYKDENYRLLLLWEKIYSRRKDLWLTQDELRKLAKIPQNKISDLEHWIYWEPKYELLNRLSRALQVPIEYFSSISIDRKTVEIYNYIFSKLKSIPDIMQYMKLPYFIDLEMLKKVGNKITNFNYVRLNYGPFDKKVYDYQKLFSYTLTPWIESLKYIYLSDVERKIIDWILVNLPINNGDKLKILSYETEPMKKLWVKLGDNKFMGKELF